MYSREIEGEEYTFGVSGKLIRNVLVMYDRQTGTLWSQLLGKAVEGELKGTELEFLPSWMTTWEDWKARHPDTQALRKGYFGDRDSYDSYYASNRTGVIGETYSDDRLYIKEFVIGVENDGDTKAYPFGVLNDEPVVNDTLGETPVLVVFDADTGSGVAFSRIVDGETLTFDLSGNLGLVDQETGTSWDGLTGEALEGPLAGSQLERIKSTHSFWFGWKDLHPTTGVYGLDELAP
ncbi:MAG: DUF3179 domain-containing protein [Chloroflexi bacterium]|nr:DUF3179 domain-containing protein [Chloroflexota bacterium]